MQNTFYVIDFDSTFTKVEGLDELAAISLNGQKDKAEVVAKIVEMTDLGMSGEISFQESLIKRIQLLRAHKDHLPELVAHLSTKISDSFLRNKSFISEYADQIYIVSSGFKEFITPIVTSMGVKEEHVYANTFEYDAEGNIIGYDKSNVLSTNKGKVKLLKELNLQGDIHVIGDGYTDYELRESGLANKFFAFTENIERQRVIDKADHVTSSLDEFLYINKLNRSQSYPKSRIKVLLLENVHQKAVQMFKDEGFQVELLKGAMDEDELAEKIKDVSILGIRSKTMVSKKVLDNANKLMCIGAFCIGTNQINLEEAQKKGIAVFNAPYSNTRSVVELAIGQIIMLKRNIVDKSVKMHAGEWDKSATNSYEIRGKKLGLIGYGNIGKQLSVVAEALGMEVYFYDLIDGIAMGNAKKCTTMAEVLRIADVLSLHVDGRAENKNMIGASEFELMKEGVIFLNLSRGHVVDIAALVSNIKSRKIWGAAIDVFPYEPKTNDESFENELRNLPNTLLTPHIGGSTEEAQEGIGEYVPSKLLDYVNKGNTFGSVNFPELQLPPMANSHRLLHIHANMPGIMGKITSIFAKFNVNIIGQYLKTSEFIGYSITDISKEYSEGMIQELRDIDNTIKFRMLY